MIQRLKFYIMTGLVVLMGAAVEAQALVPLMPQAHPLCREVLKGEKRDYVHALYFNKDGYYMSFLHSPDISSTLSLDGRCKGFKDEIFASTFQVYQNPLLKSQYLLFISHAFGKNIYNPDAGTYYEHNLRFIDSHSCQISPPIDFIAPETNEVSYFFSYAIYKDEIYAIYTAWHEKPHPNKDEWMLDYEGQKIIQNLSRADGKTMVCRH